MHEGNQEALIFKANYFYERNKFKQALETYKLCRIRTNEVLLA